MTIRTCIVVYVALMLLLGATYAVHHFELGIWNLVLNLCIAAAKASLIALFFMRLIGETHVVRIFALIGLVWLAILFTLTLADYLDREHPGDFYGAGESPG